MQTVLNGTLFVTTDVPTGFRTHEEYREYLSWRIELQVLVMQIRDFEKASSTEDKRLWVSKIKSMVTRIKERAKLFPPQAFPRDLSVMPYNNNDSDSPAPDAKQKDGTVFLNAETLIAKIHNLTGNVTDAPTVKETDNTLTFSEKMVEIFS